MILNAIPISSFYNFLLFVRNPIATDIRAVKLAQKKDGHEFEFLPIAKFHLHTISFYLSCGGFNHFTVFYAS